MSAATRAGGGDHARNHATPSNRVTIAAMAVGIECHHLTARFGRRAVLDGLDWQVGPGTSVGLLGRSGAGKTTLLRVMAGLEPSSGNCSWSGNPRGPRAAIGMMFQDLALWPHLTARQHLRCVLDAVPRALRLRRIETALIAVHLPPATWDRLPSQLSGGELQRLALARALVVEPDMLLLDEPLGQLDSALRVRMLDLLAEVLRSSGTTSILVTHRWSEAAALCRRIAVLEGGLIVAEGAPQDLYWQPPTLTVATLTGPLVAIPRQFLDEGWRSVMKPRDAAFPLEDGESVYVRPQQVRLEAADGHDAWQVRERRPEAEAWRVELRKGDLSLSLVLAQTVPFDRVHLKWTPAPSGPLRPRTQSDK